MSTTIRFSDLMAAFGYRGPSVCLSDYYGNSLNGYALGVPEIPNTGSQISLSVLQGKSSASNMVQNPMFASGSGSWTSSAGWTTTYGSNLPIVLFDGNQPNNFKNMVRFTFIQNHTIQQVITLSAPKSSYTFSFCARTTVNNVALDRVYGYAEFQNTSGTIIQTIGIKTYTTVPTTWTRFVYNTTGDMTSASSVRVVMSGHDGGNWAGQYGADIASVSVM
jgi:hypothetical protein